MTRALDLMHSGLGGGLVTAGAGGIVVLFTGAPWQIAVPALIIVGILGGLVQRTAIKVAGKAALGVVAPSGDTTAYIPTFSHIEALEIRGDLDGAAKAWAEACAEHPRNALVHVKAADFHLRLRKEPVPALALYRTARDIPQASRELVRYAQSKIVDLHLGPLDDQGRALVELRRLIEAFPGTREAEEARTVLARLKAEREG